MRSEKPDVFKRLSYNVFLFTENYRAHLKRSKCILTSGVDELQYPRILSAETVEVFSKDFRDDNAKDIEKAANTDTFLANRYQYYAWRM